MSQILIVEDETDIRELIVFNLQREGFSTLEATTGIEALALAKSKKPNLIILDLMLPELDGLAVCRELAHDTSLAKTPILMLTAKGEELDRCLGLELGADDYMVKPFSVRELILRIKAILRRHTAVISHNILKIKMLQLDPESHQVTIYNKPINLTATEFRLLEDLMRHMNLVRTREQLLNSVWGYQFEGYSRTVDTHVRRLRAKLGEAADMIETIRSIGYRCMGK